MIGRRAISGAIGLVVVGLVAGSARPGEAAPKVVLELFTSQACPSCPPADRLLGEYARRPDILALSFNIDYWDYLGWKDTLASHDNSDRQRSYATARGDRQVYTPQLVINGGQHIVGSRAAEIDAAIARAGEFGLPVALELAAADGAIRVKIGAAPLGAGMRGTIWLILYDEAVDVAIRGGENSGNNFTYHHVVRKFRPIAMWKGEPMSVDLPESEMQHAGAERCAVLLQTEIADGLPGPILGAADLPYRESDQRPAGRPR